MTVMIHDHYQRGYDAANRALDRSPLNAHDLATQAEDMQRWHLERGNHQLANWNRGFATAVREFLQDKAS